MKKTKVCRGRASEQAHLNDLVGVCNGGVAVQQVQALCGQAAALVQQLLLESACSSQEV